MSVLPELQPILEAALQAPPIDWNQPVGVLRQQADAGVVAAAAAVAPPSCSVTVDDVALDTEDGTVPLRVYRPASAPARSAPAHLFLHGGGWWMGSLDTADALCRDLAAAAAMVVVSVGYRLAPEHQFPAPVEDAYAALCWLIERSPELGVDTASVSIGGESAGANVAAGVCVAARDRGRPVIAAQWLDVPALDLTLPVTSSYREFGRGFGLDVPGIEHCVDWYVSNADRGHPYASPLGAADLRGLPPAVITVAECDPLRDQGELYARRLEQAGVSVRYRCWPGHLHGTTWLTRLLPSAQKCQTFAVESLRAFRAFGGRAPAAEMSAS